MSNGELKQLTNDSQSSIAKPSIDEVDQLADELVNEFNNPGWRSWYCGYINRFGVDQVKLWRKKARNGNVPAKLFSTYLKQASDRGYLETSTSTNNYTEQLPSTKLDTVYIPVGSLEQKDVDKLVSDGIDEYLRSANNSTKAIDER